MRKIVAIAWKDLQILFRDRAALLLMLAAPLVLTLGMGFVTGAFGEDDNDNGFEPIPLIVVNEDEGDLGRALVTAVQSADLATLLAPTVDDNLAAARAQVDADTIAAVVHVPAGFSAGLIPDSTGRVAGDPVAIELYASPARPISTSIVQSVVDGFIDEATAGVVGTQAIITELVASGVVAPAEIGAVAPQLAAELSAPARHAAPLAALDVTTDDGSAAAEQDFDPMAYMAPGFAMLFLMYTVTLGAQSILTERQNGTLARALATPTTMPQLMIGKIVGTFLSGVAQVGILVGGTSLLFGLAWGAPLGVLLLIVGVSAAATAWGLLVAAGARTPGQVGSAGTALMLLFGILSGTFFQFDATGVLGWLSRLTPNKWALDGFVALGTGGGVSDIVPNLLGLAVMTIVILSAAAAVSGRQWRMA